MRWAWGSPQHGHLTASVWGTQPDAHKPSKGCRPHSPSAKQETHRHQQSVRAGAGCSPGYTCPATVSMGRGAHRPALPAGDRTLGSGRWRIPQQRAGSSKWPWRRGGREPSPDQPLPSMPSLREEPNRQRWVAGGCADRCTGVTRDSGGLGLAWPLSGGLSIRSLRAHTCGCSVSY